MDVTAIINQLKHISNAGEKSRLIDELIRQVQKTGAPVVENGTNVTFLYRGDAQNVGIIGDLTDWKTTEYFERIPETDLFFLQMELPSDARLEYNLIIDDAEFLAVDPLNPFKSLNGLGELSELTMPEYVHHPLFREYRSGKKGGFDRVQSHEIPAGALGYSHTVHVYLPPEYASEKRSYPVVYFQDGEDYIEFAQVPHVLDQLIGDSLIEPLIAVFEAPPNRHLPASPNRMTQYGMNDNFVKFYTDELVPFIDSRYLAKPTSSSRLVVGASFGGLIAAYIAFQRPEIFGMAYSQSGYASFQNDRLINAFRESDRKPIRLYVDIGHFERFVGGMFLPAAETDFLAGNRRLRDALTAKNYDVVYREYPEGHTWGNWRRHLIDGLIHFFGVQQ
ncbi:MAG: hypothetical protein KDH95_12830 [Calditrichaeota bacterium]|nr:hypothetical protein [Calditrichota bacterium]MCB0269039.1 hypothetical protein [Calditrichota bacterium]MCB9069857.1 hypothetical protein [Calditrichia bacterium]